MNSKALLRRLEKAAKCRVAAPLEMRVNQWRNRHFIPTDRAPFCIETSSACNLNCCFCAYGKKATPRVSMPDALFQDCVGQVLGMGFREFQLTPTTGDVFMDRTVFSKFRFLDDHPEVQGYHFFTNFTVPTPKKIEELVTLRKLRTMVISIYGHDEASFVTIARSSPRIFRRLLANLRTLRDLRSSWPFDLSVGWRSTFDVPEKAPDELMVLIDELRALGVRVHPSHGLYNN